MTPRNGAEIAFGVSGVYLLGGSIPAAIASIGVALSEAHPEPLMLWLAIIATAVQAAFGGALIALRRPLAGWLAPSSQDQAPEVGVTAAHAAATSVVGVYFFTVGLLSLLREILGAAQRGEIFRSVPRAEYSTSVSVNSFAEPIATIVVGSALFLGSRGIANLWRVARAAGADPRSESSE
jgi:hypothetical protein